MTLNKLIKQFILLLQKAALIKNFLFDPRAILLAATDKARSIRIVRVHVQVQFGNIIIMTCI